MLSPGGTEVGTRLCEGDHPFRLGGPAVVGEPAADHHRDEADQQGDDDVNLGLAQRIYSTTEDVARVTARKRVRALEEANL